MTKEKIKIRKATEKDYKVISALYYEIYNLYHKNMPDYYKKMPKNTLPKGTFLNIIGDKNAFMIIAEIDKKIIGVLYAEIEKEESDKWIYSQRRVLIEELSISPLYQNRGVGSLLMRNVEKWAQNKKANNLTVLVYSFNKKAINFYEKNGYESYSMKLNKKLK